MLAALPSGGSDWIATCIADVAPSLSYSREFFCQTINYDMAPVLEEYVGDTLYQNVPNLCRSRTSVEIDALLNMTWRTKSFSFTKENYIAFQLEQFAEFFEVIVLVRSFADTFPPKRHRVMQWYDHFYSALSVAGDVNHFCEEAATTPMNRAAIGHYWFARQLVDVARKLKLPLLYYDKLVKGEVPIFMFRHIDAFALRERIMETRQQTERPTGEYEKQWADAGKLYLQLVKRYGEL